MIIHELTYVEDEFETAADGLSDFYRCTCGETFQANGDVQAAFAHGRETAPKPFIWVWVEGGIADYGGDIDRAEVVQVDYDNEGREAYELAYDIQTARRIPDRLAELPHDDPRWLDRDGIIKNLTDDLENALELEDDPEIVADVREVAEGKMPA
jgi:hypothetical protein